MSANNVNFANAYIDHLYDGSHFLRTDFDANGHVFKNLAGLGGATGKAIVFLDSTGLYTGLQDAIDALPAAGGTVYILPGYTEDTAVQIVPVDNIAVICPSRDAVITDTAGNLTTGMFATYTGTTGIDNVTLDGIHFISTGVANTTAIVFADYTPTHWIIQNCRLEDCKYGIQGSTRDGYNTNGFLDSVIRECRFYSCDYGISTTAFQHVLIDHCYLDGEGAADYGIFGQNFENVIVRDAHCYNHASHAFYIQSLGGLEGKVELRGCHAYDNDGCGFLIRGNTNEMEATPMLIGCRAERNSQHGFRVFGTGGIDGRAIFVACEAMDNSYGTANGYSGFYLEATCERVVLDQCRAYKNNQAQQKYGFEIVAGADKCDVRGGVWSPNQTAAWLDNGTDTAFSMVRSD